MPPQAVCPHDTLGITKKREASASVCEDGGEAVGVIFQPCMLFHLRTHFICFYLIM